MVIRILTIEDYDQVRNQIIEFFNDLNIYSHTIKIEGAENFDKGIERIKESDFDIVLLDLCKGKPSEDNQERPGLDVLQTIRKNTFSPVVFYTGIGHSIKDIESPIVGVVSKSEGLEKLQEVVETIVKSNIGLLKQKIHHHINESLKDFFWESVHEEKSVFAEIEGDVSLGYLMLRRIANSLSKKKIKLLLDDNKVDSEKAHPMEYYIYPVDASIEFNAGEILLKDGVYYAILTPSCDFVQEGSRVRKAEKILLAVAVNIEETDPFKKYLSNPKKYVQSLIQLIESRKGDRYFFLPETPFLRHSLVIDFQNKHMVTYDDLGNFTRVALLDSPFAESMISSFIRYYNRIGYPDIDAELILESIDRKHIKATGS